MPGASPLLEPCVHWVLRQLERATPRPLLLGLSAPQGSGKTTLVRALVPALEGHGLRAVAVSIDDFYLRREEQMALAAAHPGNRVLEHRGAPGTHDVALGDAMLGRLTHLGPRETMKVVAYDKTAHGGRGDRAPEDRWPVITGPLDVLLLEGWCWAFQPVPEADLADRDLVPVNAALPRYRSWQSRIQALMAWRAQDLESIVAWRVGAEALARGGPSRPRCRLRGGLHPSFLARLSGLRRYRRARPLGGSGRRCNSRRRSLAVEVHGDCPNVVMPCSNRSLSTELVRTPALPLGSARSRLAG
jgi:D-glycerate 3-kinase